MNEQLLIEVGVQKILSLAEETKFAGYGIVSRTVFRSPNYRVMLFGFTGESKEQADGSFISR